MGDRRNAADMKMLPQCNFLPKYMKVGTAFEHFQVDFLEFCKLFDEFDKRRSLKIRELSGGNIRTMETYLILKSPSKFCILDEPFSHLSPKNMDTFMQIIQQEKEKKGLILTDHMYHYITQASDILYVINGGASYKINSKEDLQQHGYIR